MSPFGAPLQIEALVLTGSDWSRTRGMLDGTTVLTSSAAPRTRALVEERGLRVVPVDVTEFEKLEGCVTCLSVRLRG